MARQRVSARVYPALVPVVASAGHGQRGVQRRGGRGRGGRAADVLRPGRRRSAHRLGGHRRPGDGRPQPGAGQPRAERVQVRPTAHRANGFHLHPLLRQHERRRHARRIVLGGSGIRQARGEHRRGPPGGCGGRGWPTGGSPHRGRHPPAPPTPRSPKPSMRWPTWMSCRASQACCDWKEPANERPARRPSTNPGRV